MPIRMHVDELDIDEALVRRLLTSQLPDLAELPLTTVEPWGTDHAIWRLGDVLVVRLPRIDWATAPAHDGSPVWVHGDLEGNCLVSDGRLSGLVDWGSACAGDPAVDVQVVWSPLFTDDSRRVFLEVLDVDEATVARSRGAAIHQACAALPYYLHTYPAIVERSWHKLAMLGVDAVGSA